MHSSSFIHCSIVPARHSLSPIPLPPLLPPPTHSAPLDAFGYSWYCCGSFDCIVSSWSRVVPDDRPYASQLSLSVFPPLPLPHSVSLPLSGALSICLSRVILLFMLLFPSFSHCAHLTYNYVDDIVVYVASVAAIAAVSFCRSSNNNEQQHKEKKKKKQQQSAPTMPTSFMCILGLLPLPLLHAPCPYSTRHSYSHSYLQSHSL